MKITLRIHQEGLELDEYTCTTVMPESEYARAVSFVTTHYSDPSGITVDMYDEAGTVLASHTFD